MGLGRLRLIWKRRLRLELGVEILNCGGTPSWGWSCIRGCQSGGKGKGSFFTLDDPISYLSCSP